MAKVRIFVAATLSGIIIGGAAWLVKHTVALISHYATFGLDTSHGNWRIILLGIASIGLTGWIVRHIVKLPLEHSTERIKADLTSDRTLLPWKLTYAPIALNTLTLGLGGSAGAEGPIAYSGAAISTRVANLIGIPRDMLGIFLVCGAGAGIAAIFKAPFGGVFFTLELLGYALAARHVILLAVMCLIAGLSAYAFGGGMPDMYFTTFETFSWKWYFPAAVLGVVCGVYSVYYNAVGRFIRRKLHHIKCAWLRNLLAGSVLGICLFIFPSLYGEGFGTLSEVLNGNIDVIVGDTMINGLSGTRLMAAVLAGILLVKSVATYVTNSGGGVAGEFAPTIFAGGMLGALFSTVAASFTNLEMLPVSDFIILAMSAVMAGTIQAPLTAIFIVAEMTMRIELFLPICATSTISFVVVKLIKFPKTKHQHTNIQ